jgi:hypothetical protein
VGSTSGGGFFGDPLRGFQVHDVDLALTYLHAPFLAEPLEGSGDCLAVGPDHAAQLVVGVAGGELAAAVAGDDALVLAELRSPSLRLSRRW